MLIFSKERFVPTDVNMMIIAAKDESGYFYVHRSLYDQAVILSDIYGEEFPTLIRAITGKEDSRSDVDKFFEEVPAPLNVLGAYLLLVKSELEDIVDMIGAIHVMSGPLHFRRMLQIPFEMRNVTPSFSLSIKEEYKLAWDRFFKNTIPYSDDLYFRSEVVNPMNGVATTVVPTEDTLSNVGDDGVEYADPLEALLFGSGDDLFDLDESEEDADFDMGTPTSNDAPPVIVPPVQVTVPLTVQMPETPVAEEVPIQEEVIVEPEKTGVDLLLAGDI